ncbi:ribonuclease domain-containing protein, partial [Pseudonocardia spinosispora]|uniref:ribonuclease domain-containing protein n=1 Tax=Pseudonocardia spinosispora TaxID=103441 RepID=UPI0012EC2B3F
MAAAQPKPSLFDRLFNRGSKAADEGSRTSVPDSTKGANAPHNPGVAATEGTGRHADPLIDNPRTPEPGQLGHGGGTRTGDEIIADRNNPAERQIGREPATDKPAGDKPAGEESPYAEGTNPGPFHENDPRIGTDPATGKTNGDPQVGKQPQGNGEPAAARGSDAGGTKTSTVSPNRRSPLGRLWDRLIPFGRGDTSSTATPSVRGDRGGHPGAAHAPGDRHGPGRKSNDPQSPTPPPAPPPGPTVEVAAGKGVGKKRTKTPDNPARVPGDPPDHVDPLFGEVTRKTDTSGNVPEPEPVANGPPETKTDTTDSSRGDATDAGSDPSAQKNTGKKNAVEQENTPEEAPTAATSTDGEPIDPQVRQKTTLEEAPKNGPPGTEAKERANPGPTIYHDPQVKSGTSTNDTATGGKRTYEELPRGSNEKLTAAERKAAEDAARSNNRPRDTTDTRAEEPENTGSGEPGTAADNQAAREHGKQDPGDFRDGLNECDSCANRLRGELGDPEAGARPATPADQIAGKVLPELERDYNGRFQGLAPRILRPLIGSRNLGRLLERQPVGKQAGILSKGRDGAGHLSYAERVPESAEFPRGVKYVDHDAAGNRIESATPPRSPHAVMVRDLEVGNPRSFKTFERVGATIQKAKSAERRSKLFGSRRPGTKPVERQQGRKSSFAQGPGSGGRLVRKTTGSAVKEFRTPDQIQREADALAEHRRTEAQYAQSALTRWLGESATRRAARAVERATEAVSKTETGAAKDAATKTLADAQDHVAKLREAEQTAFDRKDAARKAWEDALTAPHTEAIKIARQEMATERPSDARTVRDLIKQVKDGVATDAQRAQFNGLIGKAITAFMKTLGKDVVLTDVQLAIIDRMSRGTVVNSLTGTGKSFVVVATAFRHVLEGRYGDILVHRKGEVANTIKLAKGVAEHLGLTASEILDGMSHAELTEAFKADIRVSDASTALFTRLRDAYRDRSAYAIDRKSGIVIDEIDHVLLDNATPHILARPVNWAKTLHRWNQEIQAEKLVSRLRPDELKVDYDKRTAKLSDAGKERLRNDPLLRQWLTGKLGAHLNNAVYARGIIKPDIDHILDTAAKRGDSITIINNMIGDLMHGQRWSEGLHEAVEAIYRREAKSRTQGLRLGRPTKDRVLLGRPTEEQARITAGDLLSFYDLEHISGASATARYWAPELAEFYGLRDVVEAPPSRSSRLVELPEMNLPEALHREVGLDVIHSLIEDGQPVVAAARTVKSSETWFKALTERFAGTDTKVQLVNAKNLDEAALRNAGLEPNTVTVVTNIAGRAVDIAVSQAVLDKGGLAVVQLERSEFTSEIQLKGRTARNGAPGLFIKIFSEKDQFLKNNLDEKAHQELVDRLRNPGGVGEIVTQQYFTLDKEARGELRDRQVEQPGHPRLGQLIDQAHDVSRFKMRSQLMHTLGMVPPRYLPDDKRTERSLTRSIPLAKDLGGDTQLKALVAIADAWDKAGPQAGAPAGTADAPAGTTGTPATGTPAATAGTPAGTTGTPTAATPGTTGAPATNAPAAGVPIVQPRVAALTPTQRKAFVLYTDGYTTAEIAKKLEISQRQAKRQLNQALKGLRGPADIQTEAVVRDQLIKDYQPGSVPLWEHVRQGLRATEQGLPSAVRSLWNQDDRVEEIIADMHGKGLSRKEADEAYQKLRAAGYTSIAGLGALVDDRLGAANASALRDAGFDATRLVGAGLFDDAIAVLNGTELNAETRAALAGAGLTDQVIAGLTGKLRDDAIAVLNGTELNAETLAEAGLTKAVIAKLTGKLRDDAIAALNDTELSPETLAELARAGFTEEVFAGIEAEHRQAAIKALILADRTELSRAGLTEAVLTRLDELHRDDAIAALTGVRLPGTWLSPETRAALAQAGLTDDAIAAVKANNRPAAVQALIEAELAEAGLTKTVIAEVKAKSLAAATKALTDAEMRGEAHALLVDAGLSDAAIASLRGALLDWPLGWPGFLPDANAPTGELAEFLAGPDFTHEQSNAALQHLAVQLLPAGTVLPQDILDNRAALLSILGIPDVADRLSASGSDLARRAAKGKLTAAELDLLRGWATGKLLGISDFDGFQRMQVATAVLHIDVERRHGPAPASAPVPHKLPETPLPAHPDQVFFKRPGRGRDLAGDGSDEDPEPSTPRPDDKEGPQDTSDGHATPKDDLSEVSGLSPPAEKSKVVPLSAGNSVARGLVYIPGDSSKRATFIPFRRVGRYILFVSTGHEFDGATPHGGTLVALEVDGTLAPAQFLGRHRIAGDNDVAVVQVLADQLPALTLTELTPVAPEVDGKVDITGFPATSDDISPIRVTDGEVNSLPTQGVFGVSGAADARHEGVSGAPVRNESGQLLGRVLSADDTNHQLHIGTVDQMIDFIGTLDAHGVLDGRSRGPATPRASSSKEDKEHSPASELHVRAEETSPTSGGIRMLSGSPRLTLAPAGHRGGGSLPRNAGTRTSRPGKGTSTPLSGSVPPASRVPSASGNSANRAEEPGKRYQATGTGLFLPANTDDDRRRRSALRHPSAGEVPGGEAAAFTHSAGNPARGGNPRAADDTRNLSGDSPRGAPFGTAVPVFGRFPAEHLPALREVWAAAWNGLRERENKKYDATRSSVTDPLSEVTDRLKALLAAGTGRPVRSSVSALGSLDNAISQVRNNLNPLRDRLIEPNLSAEETQQLTARVAELHKQLKALNFQSGVVNWNSADPERSFIVENWDTLDEGVRRGFKAAHSLAISSGPGAFLYRSTKDPLVRPRNLSAMKDPWVRVRILSVDKFDEEWRNQGEISAAPKAFTLLRESLMVFRAETFRVRAVPTELNPTVIRSAGYLAHEWQHVVDAAMFSRQREYNAFWVQRLLTEVADHRSLLHYIKHQPGIDPQLLALQHYLVEFWDELARTWRPSDTAPPFQLPSGYDTHGSNQRAATDSRAPHTGDAPLSGGTPELTEEDLISAVERARKESPEFEVRALSALPEASEVWAKLRLGDLSPLREGTVFRNEAGILPQRPLGYYHEYAVSVAGSETKTRGPRRARVVSDARRLVVGELGESYYTGNNYKTITVVDTVRTLLDDLHTVMAGNGYQSMPMKKLLGRLGQMKLRANADQVRAAIEAPPGVRRYGIYRQGDIDYVAARRAEPASASPGESDRARARRIIARLSAEDMSVAADRASRQNPGFAVHSLSALPDAAEVWSRIWFGVPSRYLEDGTVFRNVAGILPQRPPGYYHEYVVPDMTALDKGPLRLVVGESGDRYYSGDHYESFTLLSAEDVTSVTTTELAGSAPDVSGVQLSSEPLSRRQGDEVRRRRASNPVVGLIGLVPFDRWLTELDPQSARDGATSRRQGLVVRRDPVGGPGVLAVQVDRFAEVQHAVMDELAQLWSPRELAAFYRRAFDPTGPAPDMSPIIASRAFDQLSAGGRNIGVYRLARRLGVEPGRLWTALTRAAPWHAARQNRWWEPLPRPAQVGTSTPVTSTEPGPGLVLDGAKVTATGPPTAHYRYIQVDNLTDPADPAAGVLLDVLADAVAALRLDGRLRLAAAPDTEFNTGHLQTLLDRLGMRDIGVNTTHADAVKAGVAEPDVSAGVYQRARDQRLVQADRHATPGSGPWDTHRYLRRAAYDADRAAAYAHRATAITLSGSAPGQAHNDTRPSATSTQLSGEVPLTGDAVNASVNDRITGAGADEVSPPVVAARGRSPPLRTATTDIGGTSPGRIAATVLAGFVFAALGLLAVPDVAHAATHADALLVFAASATDIGDPSQLPSMRGVLLGVSAVVAGLGGLVYAGFRLWWAARNRPRLSDAALRELAGRATSTTPPLSDAQRAALNNEFHQKFRPRGDGAPDADASRDTRSGHTPGEVEL